MSKEPITISAQDARRLAVNRQHLAGKLPAKPTREHILSVVRDLAFVQWDPIAVVAPSHLLSIWNRVGDLRISDLDGLLWEERKLFEHWPGRVAAIVLTEDYPLYYSMMKRYPESLGKSWGAQRARARTFLAKHRQLAKSILSQLKRGPLQLTQFKDYARTKRDAADWTPGSDVSEMLFHLEMSGEVMVVGHEGNRNLWGLPEAFLPNWVERKELSEEDVERMAAQRAIRALGTASPREINAYFPRGRYQNLKSALESLRKESTIRPVRVQGEQEDGERYIHGLDIGLLESINDAWQPRVSLLPPFDNLICSRGRTNRLFGFDYNHEMFLPEAKRKFGYYVLPILWGDRLIGRIDPLMDRSKERLLVKSVHAEPKAPGKEAATEIGDAIQRLGDFLGAREVVYSPRVPGPWRSALR